MINRWRKLGLLYSPTGAPRHPKLLSHAANPLPILLEGDVYRIYFSGRDANNRSSVGAVDINIVNRKIIREYSHPIFEHGAQGSFYAEGVSIGNCYKINGVQYMLFMGWQAPKNDHWRGDIGRLIVKQDLTLVLDDKQPLMTSDTVDPISLSYPWVMRNIDGSYSMWYGSTKTWDAGNGEMLHVIHYATSDDGKTWKRHGLAVPYEYGIAQAFSRPTILQEGKSLLHMWFSYRGFRGDKYRIGYARSDNGQTWELKLDEAGIDVSTSGWDSEMIEYPFVFHHRGACYMLFNGNNYGKTGFGLAVLE